MFNRVLIGIDDRDGGRDAIALARRLVGRGGELELAYVHGGYPLPARGSSADVERAERDHADQVLSRASEESGIGVAVGIGSASVGRGLHELAEHAGADLLVVGSTRRGLFGRVMLGNDTNRALNGAPCAVAIAPVNYAQQPDEMTAIGVAYNASSQSDHAIAVARTLAAEKGAELSALQVIVFPANVFSPGAMLTESTLESYMDDVRERIEALGHVEPHVVCGDPEEELTQYSKSLDLLVVGSRGYGPLGRLVHSSTSRELARTAHCPLLVLTRAFRTSNPQPVTGGSTAPVSV